jgi:hypothetical protein
MRAILGVLLFLAGGAVQACPAVPGDLALQKIYAEPGRHQVLRQGLWAVWYHPGFFTAEDAQFVADGLDSARCALLPGYGMQEPPNIAAGVQFNVYLHVPGQDDGFGAYGWANGVGQNDLGQPFMTLPQGAHLDPTNLDHEGFHVFQWAATSPGYWNEGDSGWFTETSAQWFSAERSPDHPEMYATASAIAGTPHLSMWHGFYNPQPGDPVHWMTETRQYGMHLFIRMLTERYGLTDLAVTEGFFNGTPLMPQDYLAQAIGPDRFADAWGDFAALMTASFVEGYGAPMPDWELSPLQRDRAIAGRADIMGMDPNPLVEDDIALKLKPGDGWAAPADRLRPRPWSWNVIQLVHGGRDMVLGLETADTTGLDLRLVTLRGGAWSLSTVAPGDLLSLSKADSAWLVLVWAPPVYAGAEPLDYRIRISPAPERVSRLSPTSP